MSLRAAAALTDDPTQGRRWLALQHQLKDTCQWTVETTVQTVLAPLFAAAQKHCGAARYMQSACMDVRAHLLNTSS
jgi:hypothetical protein